jgi:hypothetical protein
MTEKQWDRALAAYREMSELGQVLVVRVPASGSWWARILRLLTRGPANDARY